MWRRLYSQLETLSPWRSSLTLRNNLRNIRPLLTTTTNSSSPQTTTPFLRTGPLFSSDSVSGTTTTSTSLFNEKKTKKTVEDVMPIATGHEREEIEADLQGRSLSEMDYPVGPFGTKEAPAIIKSTYDKRIVGCSGGEDEDEHDVVWFWLEKGKPHECPVCSQYFVLEVVGPGGPPDGHGEDDADQYH